MTTGDARKAEGEGAEVARLAADDGQKLLDLATALYRDEMRRTVAWRQRLDRTTNWAVVLTATLLTWAFSRTDNPHYVVLVAIATVVLFLLVEARRYRYYDVWRSRLRLLEQNVFANAFAPDGTEQREWRRMLAADLRHPAFKMPRLEAVQRRLRRMYGPLLLLLLAAWLLRISAFSPGPLDLSTDAAVGWIPGTVITGLVLGFYGGLAALALWPMKRRAAGKIDDEDGERSAWDD